jgi:hypothetical protein
LHQQIVFARPENWPGFFVLAGLLKGYAVSIRLTLQKTNVHAWSKSSSNPPDRPSLLSSASSQERPVCGYAANCPAPRGEKA